MDEINFPGCSAAQCRLVIVFYDAFCLGTIEINVSTARFAPTPMIGFYLKRLVRPAEDVISSIPRTLFSEVRLSRRFVPLIRVSNSSVLFCPTMSGNLRLRFSLI